MAGVPDQSDVRRRQYTAGAGQTEFTYPFRIFEASDLEVFSKEPGEGVVQLVLNTDYTVTNVNTEGGGDVVLNVGAVLDTIITINSNVPASQDVNFSTGGKFSPQSVNFVHDKEAILIQQLKNTIDERMLTYPVTSVLSPTGGDTVLPVLPPNTGNGIPIWTKNNAGNLVAGVCEEDPDCSTLRSELASQTQVAPGSDNIGTWDTNDPGGPTGKTLTELLFDIAPPAPDDRDIVKNAVDTSKRIKFDAQEISPATTRTIIMPDKDIDLGHIGPESGPLGSGVQDGCLIENDPINTNNRLIFHPGHSISMSGSQIIELSAQRVKNVTTPWALGNAGGLFPGATIGIDDTAHCFHIWGPNVPVDCGYDDNPTADNLPPGYTEVTRVGSLPLDGSGNFYQFIQNPLYPDYFSLKDNLFVYDGSSSTTASLIDVKVPKSLTMMARLNIAVSNQTFSPGGEQLAVLVTDPQQDDVPANRLTNWTVVIPGVGGAGAANPVIRSNVIVDIITNDSGEVRIRGSFSTGTASTIRILLEGWTDLRGKG